MSEVEAKYGVYGREAYHPKPARGRGAGVNPANRFESLVMEMHPGEEPERIATEFFRDDSQTVLSTNKSPDIGFDRSLNPYRGCEHGCSYCYARPTHEYLGFSCGTDFETKIMVKEEAPALLRKALSAARYEARPLALSGVTDCYQPVERRLEITRRCLEVLVEFRHPVTVVTKNALVVRDIDLLSELARFGAAAVCLSVTTLDRDLASKLEPRASVPRARLEALGKLAEAGIPTGVMVAPIIPALNEPEIPAILEAASGAGATFAGYTVVRLPYGVEAVFGSWLETYFPERKEKVLGRIREMQGETGSNPRFGDRLRGQGVFAEQISQLFKASCGRLGLNREKLAVRTDAFRKVMADQMELFSSW